MTEQCLTEPVCLTDPICLTDPEPECENTSSICLDTRGECEIKARVKVKAVGNTSNCLTRYPTTITLEAECPVDGTIVEWIQIKPAGQQLSISTSGNQMTATISEPHPQGYEWVAVCSRTS